MEVGLSIIALWSGLALLAGIVLGAFWGDLRTKTRTETLTQAQGRVRSLDARTDHFAFGISDLEVRVDSANNEIAMLRADLKVHRATYNTLNDELRSRWDEAIECKRTLAAQEEDAIALQSEISNWKEKLDTLYKRIESGAISDRALKRELASGLSAIFAEAGDALPTVQRLLLQKTIDIGMSSSTDTQGFEEIIKLLSARVELLESQVSYWQDRSTGHVADSDAADSDSADSKGESPPAKKPAAKSAAKSTAAKQPAKATRKKKSRASSSASASR